jgi:hypothetical protein
VKEKDDKTATALNALKENLVITSGDNYVGSAEPQLREKMADLYSKLVANYDKPSSNEIDNLEMIEKRFEQAKTDFSKLKKKAKIKNLTLKPYEDFINE